MFRFVALFALVSCALAGTLPDEWEGRIVNGKDTSIEAHPYQVSLQSPSGAHFCGGSIINQDTIVTAAHCVVSKSASQIKVRLGTTNYKTGGQFVAARAVKHHEGYNSKLMINDVAIIKLSSPVHQSNSIRYIDLARNTPKTGTPAVVTGWGTKCFMTCTGLPTTLQEVEVAIVDEKACASNEYKYGNQIRETMVCAYAVDKDACQGDSGGPLVAQNQLVGIVSWGRGCASKGYPGVYCDVPSVFKWIEETSKTL